MSSQSIRFIGSRELHRDLPKVLDQLEDPKSRFVLTIHSRPKAILLGTDAFLALLRGQTPSDKLLALQLGALVQGLEASATTDLDATADVAPPTAAVDFLATA